MEKSKNLMQKVCWQHAISTLRVCATVIAFLKSLQSFPFGLQPTVAARLCRKVLGMSRYRIPRILIGNPPSCHEKHGTCVSCSIYRLIAHSLKVSLCKVIASIRHGCPDIHVVQALMHTTARHCHCLNYLLHCLKRINNSHGQGIRGLLAIRSNTRPLLIGHSVRG